MTCRLSSNPSSSPPRRTVDRPSRCSGRVALGPVCPVPTLTVSGLTLPVLTMPVLTLPGLAAQSGLARSMGTVVGFAVDRWLGEPPDAVHPLIAVGNGLIALEKLTYRADRRAGMAHVVIAGGSAFALGATLDRAIGPLVSSTLTAAVCSGGSMLLQAGSEVGEALEANDIDTARALLPSLVGRDPSNLDASEIARAVIESVAENTVDAVTATLFWGAIGGSPLMLMHRVVNTLDAMVGHRNERYQEFGWASARIDDLLNWVPARLTAAAIAVVAPTPTAEVWSIVRRDGADHPSPNGGQVEAAMAGALGITLGGANDYGGVVEVRGSLGDGPPAAPADIGKAITLASRASLAFAGGCAAVALGLAGLRHRV